MAAAQAATADAVEGTGEATEGEAKPAAPKKSKKLLIIVAAVAILALGGGGAFMSGMLDGLMGGDAAEGEGAAAEGEEHAAEEEEEAHAGVFFDLPEMLVNLTSTGKKMSFLKLKVALELKDEETLEHVEAVLPRIVDNFQVYLRGLRMEDLNGSSGLYRLREELLLRVNAAAKPAEIKDVLFKEMLVQ